MVDSTKEDDRRPRQGIESSVVEMYDQHPFPSRKDKLAYAARRMELRLFCCGLTEEDYVGKEVLDAGCGTGEYSCWFASLGANVTGIDLSAGSLDEARRYAKGAGLETVRFERRSVLETGFPDACFDLVYCTGVLHHTPDPLGGLTELCRVLRPGGKVLFSLYSVRGKLLRRLRWRIAKQLGGQDLESRVRWGRRLFPLVARRELSGAERNNPESGLYDYFAIPHESLHPLGESLRWLDRCGLVYTGSFPPASLRDYPAMFSFSGYDSVEPEFRSGLGKLFGRQGGARDMKRRRPGVVSRGLVQLVWAVGGIPIFCVCGRKQG